jgi:hypothetical protein
MEDAVDCRQAAALVARGHDDDTAEEAARHTEEAAHQDLLIALRPWPRKKRRKTSLLSDVHGVGPGPVCLRTDKAARARSEKPELIGRVLLTMVDLLISNG